MRLLTLSSLGETRLRKLIAHLRKPTTAEKFDFASVRRGTGGSLTYTQLIAREIPCGAVGCAIGHTPEVFPQLIYCDPINGLFNLNFVLTSRLTGDVPRNSTSFYAAAAALFELPLTVASALFSPYEQSEIQAQLQVCGAKATAVAVADMLEQFISLAKDKKIKY